MATYIGGRKYGYYLFLFCVFSLRTYSVEQTNIYFSNGSVDRCDPTDCLLMCPDQRIQLRALQIKQSPGWNWESITGHNLEAFYLACSGKHYCNVVKTEEKPEIKNGRLRIKYSCIGATHNFCDAMIQPTRSETHLLVNSSWHIQGKASCSCLVSGSFKLKLVDVRLSQNNRICFCEDSLDCHTNQMDCSCGPIFNQDEYFYQQSIVITLYELSVEPMPMIVWIQIDNTPGQKYSVHCSAIRWTSTTSESATTAKVTETSIMTSTPTGTTTSSNFATTTQMSNNSIVSVSTINYTPVSEESTVSNTVANRERLIAGDSDTDSFPTTGVVIPVVLVIFASACAVGIVIYCRRRRKNVGYGGSAIANPGYTDTDLTGASDISAVFNNTRSESFDKGSPQSTTDYDSNFQADDQYNVIENDANEEYNKIYFKPNNVNLDENYGHITSVNDFPDKQYDHMTEMPEADSQNYSHVQLQSSKKESTIKSESVPCKAKTNESSHTIEVPIYDHLEYKTGQLTDNDAEQDHDDYSHLPANGTGVGNSKPKRTNILPQGAKTDDQSIKTTTKAENEDIEHSYSILGGNVHVPESQTESNYNSSDTTTHPYFLLESTGNIPRTPMEYGSPEHSYFVLETAANNIVSQEERAATEANKLEDDNEQDHQYSQLDDGRKFDHTYSALRKRDN